MKPLKIIGIAVGALVILFVAAAALVASLFDPNDYKGVAADTFTARTGRTLAIDGDLTLSYFPWLAVETGGITVGNAADFAGSPEPFATVERAAARVKLLPLLLRREVEIGTVELDGLRLNLARDATGRGNWQDLADAASAPGSGEPSAASAGAQSFALEGIRVRNGAISWRENTTELKYSVTGLNLATGSIGGEGPVSGELALAFRDETSGLTASIDAELTAEITADGPIAVRNFSGDVAVTPAGGRPREIGISFASLQFDRNAGTLAVQQLTTETAGVKAAWEVQGASLLDNPSISGSVRTADAPLATLFNELGLPPPEGVQPSELGSLTLAADFSFRNEPREIAVRNVDAAALGLVLRGEGTLKGSDELAGRVEIPRFTPSKTVQSLLRTAVPPTVDVSALGDIALTARFDTSLSTGRAAIRDLSAQMLGASITGNLEAIPGDRGNVFRGSVRTSRFAPDAFAKAFAALLPQNVSPSKLGMIQLASDFTLDGAADTLSVPSFEAEVFGVKASGEVTGRNVSKNAVWNGTARVAQFSPQELIQRFGLPPQPTSDPRALTRATVTTRFSADAKNARLTDLTLALDDSKITGNFAIEGFDDPAFKFALVVDAVDADRYLPPKKRDAQAGEATAGDLELPENNTMNLDGTMQIGDLRLAGMRFESVGARVLVGGGDAKLENARAKLYGGEFSGNFHVRAAGNEPGLALDGRASGLRLEAIIEALTGEPANFSGTGSFDINLAGRGRSIIQNVDSASGNVAFEMANGAIKGFNLGRTLCAAWNVTQRAPGPAGQDNKVTQYQAIKGTATVTAGKATSNDLLARTAFMDIYGRGTLGLVEQSLNYDLDAKLTGKIDIPNCDTMDKIMGESFPFNIRGTVTDPSITPDFSKIVQRVIRDRVQDSLEDKLRDRIRGLIR